jgi:hypothetical protein
MLGRLGFFGFLSALLVGCVTAGTIRPSTLFPGEPDELSAEAANDSNQVYVIEHVVKPHSGCSAVQVPNPGDDASQRQAATTKGSGIIRCGKDKGELRWATTSDPAMGIDDYHDLVEAVAFDAKKAGQVIEDKTQDCTLGGAPGRCHVYVRKNADDKPVLMLTVGEAELTGKALVAQCLTVPGAEPLMKDVCAEVFEMK